MAKLFNSVCSIIKNHSIFHAYKNFKNTQICFLFSLTTLVMKNVAYFNEPRNQSPVNFHLLEMLLEEQQKVSTEAMNSPLQKLLSYFRVIVNPQ